MTDKGTFIVNGTERVVVSQLVRSPGVIFQPGRDAKTVFTGTIPPLPGRVDRVRRRGQAGQGRHRGLPRGPQASPVLFVLLRALGYEDQAFLERFVRHFDFLEGQWRRSRTRPTSEEGAARDLQACPPG